MMTEFKSLLRHSVIVGAGMALSKIVTILMLPIYTRYLTPTEYGIAQLLDQTSGLLGMLLGLGVTTATLRFYFDTESEEERKTIIGTAILFTWTVGAVGFVCLALSAGVWSSIIFKTDAYRNFFVMAFLNLMAGFVLDVPIAFLRVQQRSDLFVTVSLSRLVLTLGLNILFIIYFSWGLVGLLLASVVTNGLLALGFGVRTVRVVGLGFSVEKLRQMAAYGIPCIPESLGMFVLNFSDRYFLQRYGTLAEVGVYSLGYRMGGIVHAMGHSPFWQMWVAKRFEIASHPEAKRIYATTLTYVSFGYLGVGLAVAIFIPEILRVLTAPSYWSASSIVPLVLLANLFYVAYGHLQIGICLTKETRYLAFVVGVCGVLNVALNFLFIPPFLSIGAAVATCLSFVAMAVLIYWTAQRLYPVPWEFNRIGKMILLAGVLYAISLTLTTAPQPVAFILKMGLVLGFPVILYFWDFFTPEEVTHLRRVERLVATRLRLSKVTTNASLSL